MYTLYINNSSGSDTGSDETVTGTVAIHVGKIDKKHPRKLKQPRTEFFVFGFGIWQVN